MNAPDFTPAQDALIARAAALAPAQAAELLLQMARGFWRGGEAAKFAACFGRAFALKPAGEVAALAADDAGEQRAIALALIAHGVRHAAVIASLGLAEARLGNGEAARRLFDLERFLRTGMLDVAEDFHAVLAREIKADLKFYEKAEYRAIRQGWRHNALFHTRTPAIQALRGMLEQEVERYIAALPRDVAHPLLAARPARTRMEGWAVVSGSETHHTPHIHPYAWITGVYYVVQPAVSLESRRGWLRIGPPPQALAGWETRWIEPRPGSFVLMPAYFYHDTEPMGAQEERICVAFEVLDDTP